MFTTAQEVLAHGDFDNNYLEQIAADIHHDLGEETAYFFDDGSILIHDHELDEIYLATREWDEDGEYLTRAEWDATNTDDNIYSL